MAARCGHSELCYCLFYIYLECVILSHFSSVFLCLFIVLSLPQIAFDYICAVCMRYQRNVKSVRVSVGNSVKVVVTLRKPFISRRYLHGPTKVTVTSKNGLDET